MLQNDVIVFRSHLGEFKADYYSPSETDSLLSVLELEGILQRINKIVKTNSQEGKYRWIPVIILSPLSILWYFMPEMVNATQLQIQAQYSFYIFLFLAFLLLVTFIHAITDRYQKKQLIRSQTSSFLEAGKQIWAKRGLRWNIPQDFPEKIELHKEYRKNPLYTELKKRFIQEQPNQISGNHYQAPILFAPPITDYQQQHQLLVSPSQIWNQTSQKNQTNNKSSNIHNEDPDTPDFENQFFNNIGDDDSDENLFDSIDKLRRVSNVSDSTTIINDKQQLRRALVL